MFHNFLETAEADVLQRLFTQWRNFKKTLGTPLTEGNWSSAEEWVGDGGDTEEIGSEKLDDWIWMNNKWTALYLPYIYSGSNCLLLAIKFFSWSNNPSVIFLEH